MSVRLMLYYKTDRLGKLFQLSYKIRTSFLLLGPGYCYYKVAHAVNPMLSWAGVEFVLAKDGEYTFWR